LWAAPKPLSSAGTGGWRVHVWRGLGRRTQKTASALGRPDCACRRSCRRRHLAAAASHRHGHSRCLGRGRASVAAPHRALPWRRPPRAHPAGPVAAWNINTAPGDPDQTERHCQHTPGCTARRPHWPCVSQDAPAARPAPRGWARAALRGSAPLKTLPAGRPAALAPAATTPLARLSVRLRRHMPPIITKSASQRTCTHADTHRSPITM
jgi:hypothetical protein